MMDKVTFRKPTLQDHRFVQGIWEDPETMEAVGGVWPTPADEYARWYAYQMIKDADRNCYYLVFYGDTCVGEVSFHRFDPKTKTADLNIKTKAAWRGKGLGRQALHFILSVFFREWHGLEMKDTVRSTNSLGCKALLSFGFRERERLPNGDYQLFLGLNDFNSIDKNDPLAHRSSPE